ncbi:MAG: glycosyltransferase family 2 protein, partial [Clostridium sp.]
NRYYEEDTPHIILNNEELMKELVINERVKNFAWGKLYKTNLIRDIKFKKGVLFEDVFWAHKVMSKVNKYVILNEPLCYYMQREDSIVATYTIKNLDIIEGLKERHDFIKKNYSNLINESYKIILKTNLMHYNLLMLNRDKDKDGIYRKEIQKYIKTNYEELRKSIEDDNKLKRQLYLFMVCPVLNILQIVADKSLRKIKLGKSPLALKRIDNI